MQKLLAVTLVASSLTVTSAHAQSVWVAPSSQKVRPTDPSGSATQAGLEAARNEFEAFHVVVQGGASGAKGITVTAGPLVGPNAVAISDVRVYREGWYDVSTPSNVQGAPGRWPDAEIPAVDELDNQPRNAFPYDVPANEQQPVLVEYHVPPDAPAGWYNGTVHVAGGVTADVPVKLYVHAFTLPSTSSLRTAYSIGWADACVAHFGSYAACGADAGAQELVLKYAKIALDHRISLSSAASNGPTQNADGSFDWATWDQSFGPLLDGGMNGRLVGAKLTALQFQWVADQAHYNAWAQHFKQKGWLARTFDYTCDEPPGGCDWSSIAPRAAMVHAADPTFETLVTTSFGAASQYGLLGAIDTLVTTAALLDPRPPDIAARTSYDGFLKQSPQKQLWMYQGCDTDGCNGVGPVELSGWPTHMIDAPATQNRAFEWQVWRQKATGELYYDVSYAFPRGDAWTNQYYFGGNGDGTLFYPGTPARIGGTSQVPVASLRLKMIREGLEDYEYLKALADAGDPAMADAEAAALSPHAWQNETDPAKVDAARHRIALRIEALTGQTPPPMDGPAGMAPGSSDTSTTGTPAPAATPDPTAATPSTAKSGGCSALPGGVGNGTPLVLLMLCALLLAVSVRKSG